MGKRTEAKARHRAPCRLTCDRPASWCESHHLPDWQHGGTTNIDTMVLLCPYHHRNYERLGWTCHIIDGIPWWTPPTWIDKDQKPLRNMAHGP